MTQALIVWQLTDGKRGHERQVEGLLAALGRHRTLTVETIPVPPQPLERFMQYLLRRAPAAPSGAAPQLLLGAGRACQWPLLAARRALGGRAVYLMRPVLPTAWFDLCIVPRHDGLAAGGNVIVSEGPLNPLSDHGDRERATGLILLGGPSRHHDWDDKGVLAQLGAIVRRRPDLAWTLGDSRRTPPGFAARAAQIAGLRIVSHRDSDPQWLPQALAGAAEAWVSADSASMLYEALTAGADVGVITLPVRRLDRISNIAGELHARGWIRRIDDPPDRPRAPRPRLAEAARCAELLLARWPDLITGTRP